MLRKIIVPIFIALSVSLFSLSFMGWNPVFALDDAYIVQHSVGNIINFSGENTFLDSGKNAGLTSLLHVSLVSLLSIFIDVNWSQFIVASLAYAAFLTLVFIYAERLNKNIVVSITLTLVAALSGFIIEQTYNGLETILVVLSVILALYLFRESIPKNKLSFVLLTIMPFIRPELAFLSFILLARSLWSIKKEGNTNELKKIILVLGASALILSLYSILMTGGILPNTAGAKKYFFAEACRDSSEKIWFILTGIKGFVLSLGLLSLGFIFILFTRFRFIFLLFALIFYSLYYLELPGGVHHNFFRYQYIFYSFAIVGIIEFLSFEKIRKFGIPVALIILVSPLIFISKNIDQFKGSLSFTSKENFGVSYWIRNNVPKDKIILIHDAGVISTVTNNRLVDLVGLKTSSSVIINKETRWAECANSPKAADAIASKYNAKYLVVLDGWDHIFQITNSLKQAGWRVQRVDAERGNSLYKVYEISK